MYSTKLTIENILFPYYIIHTEEIIHPNALFLLCVDWLQNMVSAKSFVISSEQLGKSMIKVARNRYSKSIIESSELKKV